MKFVFSDEGLQDDIHVPSHRIWGESREKSLLGLGAHPP